MDQKEAELLRLQEENLCLREIIQHINEGVILTDQECHIVVFNPAKERMEQMKASDVIGKVSWDAYSHSNKEISEHKRVFDTGIPILNSYRPHAYIGETPVYISYSTYPVKHDGRVIGVYTVSRNEQVMRELLYETIERKRMLHQEHDISSEALCLAPGTHFSFSDIVGSSPIMKDLIREAQTVAGFQTPVLIIGETGSGKEVLAQSIHNFSGERKKFVAINCAAIPENLMESLLFGTVKGAYTGAVDSAGLFREAEGGTLFLDEVNSMSLPLQAKLLRVLQEMTVRPLGGRKEYPVNFRLICASNEEPEVLLQEKRLRDDLFYRIAGFCLWIPPLRERTEDILELAWLFIQRYNREFGRHITSMAPELETWLRKRPWPGNTRELQNAIQNMMLKAWDSESELSLRHIPSYARNTAYAGGEERGGKTAEGEAASGPVDLNGELKRCQRRLIEEQLERCGYNMTKTAENLGIGRQNLLSRMKRLDIEKKKEQK